MTRRMDGKDDHPRILYKQTEQFLSFLFFTFDHGMFRSMPCYYKTGYIYLVFFVLPASECGPRVSRKNNFRQYFCQHQKPGRIKSRWSLDHFPNETPKNKKLNSLGHDDAGCSRVQNACILALLCFSNDLELFLGFYPRRKIGTYAMARCREGWQCRVKPSARTFLGIEESESHRFFLSVEFSPNFDLCLVEKMAKIDRISKRTISKSPIFQYKFPVRSQEYGSIQCFSPTFICSMQPNLF